MSAPSATLAGPPGECCFTGVKHTGTPVGSTITISGLNTYLSEPPETSREGNANKKIILFFSDVFGPLFLNNQLLQDYFASLGFIVLGPDYFFGDSMGFHRGIEPGFDDEAWVQRQRKPAHEVIPKWLEAVKEKYGTTESGTKYTAVGYCFGAPFVLELGASDFLSAGAIVHPAFSNEDHFENVKAPLLLSCPEVDHTFPIESRRRAEDILVKNKAFYHIQVFSGVAHGFSVRGDPAIENTRWAKEESANGVARWFTRFTK